MAWDAKTYLKEARDSHGRWISGAGALGDAIDDLVKSKAIDTSTAKAISTAIARHSDMGRGLPKDAEGDKAKTLAYLAQTLRHDSLTYRQQKPPDITQSKRLSRMARSVETVHAAVTGKPRKNMEAHSPYHETPESQPLDTPSGTTPAKQPEPEPKVVKPAQAAPAPAQAVPPPAHGGVTATVKQLPNGKYRHTVMQNGKVIDTRTSDHKYTHARIQRWAPVGSEGKHSGPNDFAVRYASKHTPNGVAMEMGYQHDIVPITDESQAPSAQTPTMRASDLRAQQTGVALKPESATALKQYVTGSADTSGGNTWAMRTISRKLRSANPQLNKTDTDRVNAMDDAFRAMPATTGAMTLYRGIDTDKNGNSRLKVNVGDKITDNGYMSTSTSRQVASDFAGKGGDVLKLTLPAGSHPLDVNAHVKGGYGSEREILIPRGAEIRVTHIEDNTPKPGALHGRVVHAELVLPDLPRTIGDDGKPEEPSPDVKSVDADTPQGDTGTPPVAAKAAEEPKVAQSAISGKAVEDVAVGDKVSTPDGVKTVKSIRKWPNGNVTLRWQESGSKKSTTYKPGHQLSTGGAAPQAAPQTPQKSESAEPKVVRRAAETKPKVAKAAEPVVKIPAAPKTKLKAQNVKIAATQLRRGDLINDKVAVKRNGSYLTTDSGNVRNINVQQRVLTVGKPTEDGRMPVTLSQYESSELQPGDQLYRMSGTGYWKSYKHIGEVQGGVAKHEPRSATFNPNTVLSVRREVEVKGAAGKKIKLEEHPDATALHMALQSALDGNGDLDALDPAHRNLPAGQSVGHVQQFMYDMAVGKQNGVSNRTATMTDEDARKQLEATGELDRLRDEAENMPYKFEKMYISGQFRERHNGLYMPQNSSVDDLTRMHMAMSMPQGHKSDWASKNQNLKDANGYHSIHDYAKSLTDADFDENLDTFRKQQARSQAEQLIKDRPRMVEEALKKSVDTAADRLRRESGVAKYSFNLPTWDESEMEPQTWDFIKAEMAKQADPHKLTLSDGTIATRQLTPSFYNAGLVDDGVLYHRQTGGSVDPDKLAKGVRQAAIDSGVAGAYEGNADVLTKQYTDGVANLDDFKNKIDKIDENIYNTPQMLSFKNKLNDLHDTISQRIAPASVTNGHISSGPANLAMRKIMEANGAIEATDPTRRSSKGNWTELKPGNMLVLHDGEQRELTRDEQIEQLNTNKPTFLAFNSWTSMGPESQQIRSQWKNANTLEEHRQALDAYSKFVADNGTKMLPKNKRKFDKSLKQAQKHIDNVAKGKVTSLGGKRIEYVPWQQENSATVTPRSDRGRLTLHGYTPEEAAAKLKELGIIGDLEPELPAQQIFRSGRRSGGVRPLHPDYVRGVAPPPDTSRLTQHGITAWRGSNNGQTLEAIARTGGIQSIADRHALGIHASGASVVGDAASGIDHVAFQSMGGGGAVGSGAQIKLLAKPDVMLRRDVLLAPTDFGGGKNRYNLYKSYRDKIEAQAGEEVQTGTTLWTPLSPAARQKHLDNVSKNPGSSEYNVAGGLHMNDVAAIQAPDSDADDIRRMLNDMHEQGIIDHVPVVVNKRQFTDMSTGRAPLPDQPGFKIEETLPGIDMTGLTSQQKHFLTTLDEALSMSKNMGSSPAPTMIAMYKNQAANHNLSAKLDQLLAQYGFQSTGAVAA